MAEVGTKHLGNRGERVVYVDADPTATSVNAPKGSLIVFLGTPVQFFTKDDDGDTTNSTEVGAGGGGALEFVSETEVTGAPATNLDITGFDGTASEWIVKLYAEATAANFMRVLMGLIAAFKSTDYVYHGSRVNDTVATYDASAATADNQYIVPFLNLDPTTASPYFLEIHIFNPALTDRRKTVLWRGVMKVSTGGGRSIYFAGSGYNDVDNTAFDTIRFNINTTTLAVGTVARLYKVLEA